MHAPSPSGSALKLADVVKTYGDFTAVAGLDLDLKAGEFYALLGANGAGKTTTMRMVAGILAPTRGTIHVQGLDIARDPARAKAAIAWMPDEPLVYDRLTPLELIEFTAGLWSVPGDLAARRAEDLLQQLELWEVRDARCEGFSRGMKQKTALAAALVHEPTLLLLDEPFSGLDAAIARQVKDMLSARARAGATIVLTTHVMEIAERLAERIGILHRGRLIAEGGLEELRALAGRPPGAPLEDVFIDLTTRAATGMAA